MFRVLRVRFVWNDCYCITFFNHPKVTATVAAIYPNVTRTIGICEKEASEILFVWWANALSPPCWRLNQVQQPLVSRMPWRWNGIPRWFSDPIVLFVKSQVFQLALQRTFQLTVKPKLKNSLWTITNYTDNPGNQSKLKVNTCSWHEVRENVRERVTTGFCLTSDWITK